MLWSEAFLKDNPPQYCQIQSFINSNLLDELLSHMQNRYGLTYQIQYSSCPMQRGWNLKFKKGGRSLCTLYPMEGYFIALVVIGEKELPAVNSLYPFMSSYVQDLYSKTPFSCGGKWLMLQITDEAVLRDVTQLIQMRAAQKK
jgi:hypothetical protein